MQCGISSPGADLAGRNEAVMNSTQHDELAQLFAQNMQLSYQAAAAQQQHQQQQQQQEPVQVQHIPQLSEKQEEAPIAYISTHYTPTAHLRPDTTSDEPSRSPPPPYNDDGLHMPEAMAQTLRDHSINPSTLLPNQIQLFANADYEQRLRLLELWRIAPPSYPMEQFSRGQTGEWAPTSVQQEEDEARMRYEQNMHGRGFAGHEEHMLDTYIPNDAVPISPIREAGETAWPPAARMRAASIAAGRKLGGGGGGDANAEPYMSNGYQSAQSVDPVYAAAAGLWQAPSYAQAIQQQQQQQQQEQEHQYGMFEQIRNHADWEAMNERVAREKLQGVQGGGEGLDEDMEL
ncbi:hypothetical protein LTR78_002555 [Recurvomyces mirabilis]|uniref:Uncharacterized protein n=1 Tax=Recurvomyces mirabilis TaxID=574656 RepID=A0AAE0WU95_9PEZI|nr:hypothetical protein LTR78_002555 [Recurvomyces mirabilis]